MSSAAGKLDYQDYLCFPDDGKRHEIIDGDHYESPAPSPVHQQVSRRIHERVGVREYWVVDPHEHSLLQMILADGTYRERRAESVVAVTYLPNVTVDLDKVW